MEAEAARKRLVAQHEQIRSHLVQCEALARRLSDGEPVRAELDDTLARLRGDLAEHNSTETNLVSLLLRGSPGWGSVLIDRMLEEHVAEHAVFWELLTGTTDEVTARMDNLVDEIDAHMAAEERTFLSPLVLRNDVIARHNLP